MLSGLSSSLSSSDTNASSSFDDVAADTNSSVQMSFEAFVISLISFRPSLNAGAAAVRSLYVPCSFRFLFRFSSSLNLFHSADSGAL